MLVLSAIAASGGCSAARSTTQQPPCQLPPGGVGYPVTARLVHGALATDDLTAVARAVAAAWSHSDTASALPAGVRALFAGLEPPEVFARGDWNPQPGDTATIAIDWVEGALPGVALRGAAGEPTDFQQRAFWAVHHAIEDALAGAGGRNLMPLTIPGDSSRALLLFGAAPEGNDGLARFAVVNSSPTQTRPVRVEYPEVARQLNEEAVVRVGYVVGADGRVDTSLVRVIEAPYREFLDAVKVGLARSRMSPLMLDCRAYASVAIQEFRFKLIP